MIALLVVGMPLYDAVVHTFATMATGGFSPQGESIAAYDNAAIEAVITVFMGMAGVSFGLYFAALRGSLRRLYRDPELRLYLGILLVSTAAVAVSLMVAGPHDSWTRALRDGAFQVVSIQTTTGFISADYEPWNSFAKTLLLLLMFVGGCAGSTAGGIKVVRLLVLAKNARYEVRRELHPQAVLPVKVSGRVIPEAVRNSVLGFFFLYVSVFVVATLLLSASNVSILTAASAVAATLNNIGPGLELVGATKNFAPIADYGKVVLIGAMVLGRLELMAILVLFTRSFWRR
jgi:trk system potassium uptake protein TrkH